MSHEPEPLSESRASRPRLRVVPQQRGFAAYVGPFYEVELAHGMRRALLLDSRHLNASGVIDGGALSTFAEFTLAQCVADDLDSDIGVVTIEISCQFHAAAHSGRWVYGEAQVLRRTRSLVFAAGEIFDQTRRVAFASGIFKILEAE